MLILHINFDYHLRIEFKMKQIKPLLLVAIGILMATLPMSARAQSFPPVWKSTSTYAAGDIVNYGGNWYRAMKALSAGGPFPSYAYGSWELNYVRSNTTLTVGSGQAFGNLIYAWQFARNARIADAAYVHFSIVTTKADFAETFTAPFSLDHGSGALMSIIADNVLHTSLIFNHCGGFVIDTGHAFGTLSNLDINTNSGSTANGITATGGSISQIELCNVIDFEYGLVATQNGSLSIDGLSSVANSTDACMATFGGTIYCAGTSFSGNGGSTTGLYAGYAGSISAPACTLTGFNIGAEAQHQGVINVEKANISSNNFGCFATGSSHIDAEFASVSEDSGFDLAAADGSTIDAKGVTSPTENANGSMDGSYIYTS